MVNHRKFPNLSQIQKIIQKIQNFWENDFGISQKFFHHHPKSSNSGTERRSSSPRWGNGQRATVYSNIIYGIYIYTEVYYFHTIIIAHVIVLRIYIYTVYWLITWGFHGFSDVSLAGFDGSWSWHCLGFDVNIQLGIPRFPWPSQEHLVKSCPAGHFHQCPGPKKGRLS